jgi:hypothetical protein
MPSATYYSKVSASINAAANEARRFGNGFCNGCNGYLKEEVGRNKKDKARRKFELKSETKINPKHNLADYL